MQNLPSALQHLCIMFLLYYRLASVGVHSYFYDLLEFKHTQIESSSYSKFLSGLQFGSACWSAMLMLMAAWRIVEFKLCRGWRVL